ncbi:MAG: sigma 54-dependent Fis family transcriptional regulator [Deltaproteobacteria bacterium]|nr:sigma 54-dependent Fis family transcriptional regulator [Deltaproteobacteria bacterium]
MNKKVSRRARDDTRQLIRTPGLSRPKLRLEVMSGMDAGAVVVSGEKVLHIGSQHGSTLELGDPAVSRIHVQLTNAESGVRVRDLESTNGTWLPGGVRIQQAMVPSGTVIILGQTQVRLDTMNERVPESLSVKTGFGGMVGLSAGMRSIFSLLQRVAPTDETILITGETGTGKELCARSIVDRSRRAEGPFVVVDCGAIAPSLLESELFGHVRGAFTGALDGRQGAFERAHGGTIFLDEIGELPVEFQTRLLRAVENRSVRRVGGSEDIPLDIRIMAATNRCLEEEVNRGTFRPDLYYRLSVVQIRLPPLRERPEDIELIARGMMAEIAPDLALEQAVDPAQLKKLMRYRWPGNVRELRNHLSRLVLGDMVITDLPTGEGSDGAPSGEVDLSLSFKDGKEGAISHFERAYLTQLLEHTKGNISEAARLARTDRNYLTRLLHKYGIHPR